MKLSCTAVQPEQFHSLTVTSAPHEGNLLVRPTARISNCRISAHRIFVLLPGRIYGQAAFIFDICPDTGYPDRSDSKFYIRLDTGYPDRSDSKFDIRPDTAYLSISIIEAIHYLFNLFSSLFMNKFSIFF